MDVLEKNSITEEITGLIEQFGRDRSSLLPVLQGVQRKHQHISDFAQQEIARLLDIHPVEVFSVISFYSFLHSKPKGRKTIRLCKTIICDLLGKNEIE
ncbi:MAG: NAD(P)H-dependent oxidoreductase subunit E, partial [Melioribacteraceae bacterium]|nr:NAD(P)H-dependent oxidoreductase subunit E [Melioribacteraceae bacterium]